MSSEPPEVIQRWNLSYDTSEQHQRHLDMTYRVTRFDAHEIAAIRVACRTKIEKDPHGERLGDQELEAWMRLVLRALDCIERQDTTIHTLIQEREAQRRQADEWMWLYGEATGQLETIR